MAIQQMTFSFTAVYFVYVLAVTITYILMFIIGSWIKRRFQKGGLRFSFVQKSMLRKKFFGFFLFISCIFLLGWLSERLLTTVNSYLLQNVATGISGILFAFFFTWVLYELLIWRKYNK